MQVILLVRNIKMSAKIHIDGSREMNREGSLETSTQHPQETEGVFDSEVITQLRRTMLLQGSVRYEGARSRYTIEQPNRPLSDLCFLLVPGYMGVKGLYQKQRHATAEAGFTAVTFKPPRTQDLAHSLDPRHLLHPDRLLVDAVEALMLKLNYKHGFERFVLPGHSMGGPAALRAAMRQAQLVEKVILVGSAGLTGHNIGKLALRMPGVALNEVWKHRHSLRENTTSIIRREAEYVGPAVMRTIGEGVSVANVNIVGDIPVAQAMGIAVDTQQFASDEFFPEHLARQRVGEVVDTYHVHPDSTAVHVWPQVDPIATAHDQLDLVA